MLEFVYDTAGRETIRKATTVGSGFDSAVLRIERAYDSLSRPTTVTQYDAASSGSVTDQTQFAYDDWGPVSSFKIDKDSAISGGGNEYTVSYTYAKATGGRQTVRRSAITLPSSRSITFTYGTSPSHDDELSRVTKVKDGALRLGEYTYKGTADLVGTSNAEPSMESTVFDPSGSTYPDLDTFGRVTRSKWSKQYPISKDFYKVELTYDRNSNITWALDKVHTGFDVYYTNDPLNRLTAADEGTENTGSITSRKRKQEWTLSHTGNWDREKLDLDGNGSWGGSNEHDDTRTHTKANAITTQDLDSTPGTTGNNYSLTHDLVGNLTNDAQTYKYEWDVFGRLRKVKNQSNTLVAEYRYNGLGFRIAWHEDTDNDGDADASDKWYYPMYDEAWRLLAVYRESDSSPKEEWVPQLAGLDGFGGSSMLDGVICRYKDANTSWTAASDGVLEERRYLCQNWRGDVSAVIDTNGAMVEWVKYFSYGIPFALPAGDTNSDGDCDASDITQIQTWIDAPAYDIRGDLDLDGDVDATDKSTAQGSFQGTTLGFSVLSNVGNRRGYAGYERDVNRSYDWHVRRRVMVADKGRWSRRDPLFSRLPSTSIYEYCSSGALGKIDSTGLVPTTGCDSGQSLGDHPQACGLEAGCAPTCRESEQPYRGYSLGLLGRIEKEGDCSVGFCTFRFIGPIRFYPLNDPGLYPLFHGVPSENDTPGAPDETGPQIVLWSSGFPPGLAPSLPPPQQPGWAVGQVHSNPVQFSSFVPTGQWPHLKVACGDHASLTVAATNTVVIDLGESGAITLTPTVSHTWILDCSACGGAGDPPFMTLF